MITMLKSWNGPCEINGIRYSSVDEFISGNNTLSGRITVKLLSNEVKPVLEANNTHREARSDISITQPGNSTPIQYKITVKKYMTEKSNPGFTFMADKNNDVPMPLRTMIGTVLQETKGMVKMHLTGFGEETCTCMRCGRTLTNKISRFYGIGPECMSKLGLVRNIDDVEGIKEDLAELEWEGWVIKSAILEKEEVYA